MKKKVVAAALVCSVLGSSHANEVQQYDEYGDNYQNAVQRPVQRLDRFRRYSGQRTNEASRRFSTEANSRFSNEGQSDSNYVINDQTGQKMYLHEIRNSGTRSEVNHYSHETKNYDRNSQASRGSGGHQGGQRVSSHMNSSNYQGQNKSQSNEQSQWSHYDFTNNAADQRGPQNWRAGNSTQGRFAAAQSHHEKLQKVRTGNESWNSSSMDSIHNVNQKDASWNKPVARTQYSGNNHQTRVSREWSQQQQNSGAAQNETQENYAMDNGGFWPTRAQQTRYSQQPSESFHGKTDELSSNPRRIYSRMEDADPKPQQFSNRNAMTTNLNSQAEPQSEYQSLRRPRVRVDLTQSQKNRSKRQRRSWFPNPFRGVSRMFSGIFGRR